jgi:hypothetical protein
MRIKITAAALSLILAVSAAYGQTLPPQGKPMPSPTMQPISPEGTFPVPAPSASEKLPKVTVTYQEAITLFMNLCINSIPDMQRIKAMADKEEWQLLSTPPNSSNAEGMQGNWLISADKKIFFMVTDRKIGTIRHTMCDIRIVEANPAAIMTQLGQSFKSFDSKAWAGKKGQNVFSFGLHLNDEKKTVDLVVITNNPVEDKK